MHECEYGQEENMLLGIKYYKLFKRSVLLFNSIKVSNFHPLEKARRISFHYLLLTQKLIKAILVKIPPKKHE